LEENSIIHNLITFIAAVAFFAPLVALISRKFQKHPFFSWFAFYWAFSGLVNLAFIIPLTTNKQYLTMMSDIINFVDGILVLFILYKTLTIKKVKSAAGYIFISFLTLSLLAIAIGGFYETVPVIIGTGVALSVMLLLTIIISYLGSTNKDHIGSSKQLVYYALLFEFGISIINYLYSYIFPEKGVFKDNLLIYHISIIASTTLASFAILLSVKKANKKKVEAIKVEKEVEIQFL